MGRPGPWIRLKRVVELLTYGPSRGVGRTKADNELRTDHKRRNANEVMPAWAVQAEQPAAHLEVFIRAGCPHCDAAKPFLLDLQRERPSLRITVYDLAQDPAARQRLPATARPSTSEVSQTCREESSRLADEFRRGLQANIRQDIEHLLLGQLAAKSMHRAEENSIND